MRENIKRILLRREAFLVFFIILLGLIFGIKSEFFFTGSNFRGLMLDVSVYSIVSVGMTLLFIAGGMDISTGTHVALLSVILGILLGNEVPVSLSILIVIILGLMDGFIIGLITTKLRVDPLITTLGTLFIFKGLSFIIGTQSKVKITHTTPSFGNFPEVFLRIGGGKIWGIEFITFYALAIIIIMIFLLRRNRFFRLTQNVGGNEQASRLAGIKVAWVRIFCYMMVSGLVAIATILKVSRVGVASSATGGQIMGVTIIVAVIVGGASIRGGTGSILGSVLGVLLILLIKNGITVTGANTVFTSFIIGIILLFVVTIDEILVLRNARKYEKKRLAQKIRNFK